MSARWRRLVAVDDNGGMELVEPGGHIHHTDPFATPEGARSPVRRLRGRLATAVTLWSADHPGGDPAGLTVSSTLVADGNPARLLGLVDAESDLWAAAEATGRFAVALLGPAHRHLADRFAGLLPAPGGPFRGHDWVPTGFGPVPADVSTWAGCRLDGARPFGWGLLVEATVMRVEIGAAGDAPVVHFRGRYRELS